MPNKLQAYAEQAERTARQITGSHLAWTAFLTTAARLYKYPYNEQLMIYLIRNRKGHLPHIVVVTGEPMPARLASLALGTGDIDCVYHFALYELVQAVKEAQAEDSIELLDMLIQGKRLKDISDLPLDLTV